MILWDLIYSYILPLTPTALTVAGWVILSKREQSRQVKERRSKRIDAAIELIKIIEKQGLEYHQSLDASCEVLSQEIVFGLHRLARLCGKISLELDHSLTRFRRAVSGGDFQAARREPKPANHPTLYRIRKAASDLVIILDNYHDDLEPSTSVWRRLSRVFRRPQ